MEEFWKDIKNYEGKYQISNFGRVKSLSRPRQHLRGGITKERILKTPPDGNGYPTCRLYSGTRISGKTHKVYKLVSIHFIDNTNNLPVINHIDGNKLNSHVSNLEWCTHSYNIKDGYRRGVNPKKATNAKLNFQSVIEIRKLVLEGVNYSVIAKMYGVKYQAIRRIATFETWRDDLSSCSIRRC